MSWLCLVYDSGSKETEHLPNKLQTFIWHSRPSIIFVHFKVCSPLVPLLMFLHCGQTNSFSLYFLTCKSSLIYTQPLPGRPINLLRFSLNIQILKPILSLEAHFTTTIYRKAFLDCFGQSTLSFSWGELTLI